MSYPALLERLADSTDSSVTSVRDLPELALEDLATVLQHYPGAFIESMAEFDVSAKLTADYLADAAKSPSNRYALIGIVLTGAIRHYVLPLILRDLQALLERRRELDALEDLGSHFPKTDEARELATELGLGRSLS